MSWFILIGQVSGQIREKLALGWDLWLNKGKRRRRPARAMFAVFRPRAPSFSLRSDVSFRKTESRGQPGQLP